MPVEVSRQTVSHADTNRLMSTQVTYDDGSVAVLSQSAQDTIALDPVGVHFTLTLTTADVETLEPPEGSNRLLLQVLTQNMRYTFAGDDPTSTTGFRWTADLDPAVVVFAAGATMRVIGEQNGVVVQGQWIE